MIAISIFDRETGSIEARMQIPAIEDAPLQCTPLQNWISEQYHPDEFYVRNGQAELRPTLPAFDYSDLAALPEGTEITVKNEVGDSLTITDLSEPLTLTDPGLYRFEVAPPFPFLPHSVEVDHA